MIFENAAELRDRIEEVCNRRVRGEPRIYEDTSNYMTILGGSVLRLDGSDYFVLGDTREGRFGIDDQPKHWVKAAVDLTTARRKIIKLVFFEEFETTLGFVKIRCRRSPEKESKILSLVSGHPRFMQGFTVADIRGNPVRVVEFIPGQSLYVTLGDLDMDHQVYLRDVMPNFMQEVISCLEALAELHRHGQHHGDVRNDHLLIERETERLRWIDFDYEVNYLDYDLWSVGNVLSFVVGKGIHTFRGVAKSPAVYPYRRGDLTEDDALVIYRYRVGDLGKLFPYLPDDLCRILRRFTIGAPEFYDDLERLIADLRALYPFRT